MTHRDQLLRNLLNCLAAQLVPCRIHYVGQGDDTNQGFTLCHVEAADLLVLHKLGRFSQVAIRADAYWIAGHHPADRFVRAEALRKASHGRLRDFLAFI
jgi:hypothetical protein